MSGGGSSFIWNHLVESSRWASWFCVLPTATSIRTEKAEKQAEKEVLSAFSSSPALSSKRTASDTWVAASTGFASYAGFPYILAIRTVIETPTFQKSASRLWSDGERVAFIDLIALNPLAGDVIPGAEGAVGVALIAAWFGALQRWPDANLSPVGFVGFFLAWPYLIAPPKKKQ